jgi:hypothetical protein
MIYRGVIMADGSQPFHPTVGFTFTTFVDADLHLKTSVDKAQHLIAFINRSHRRVLCYYSRSQAMRPSMRLASAMARIVLMLVSSVGLALPQ